jgi:beta-lactamase superfamily II metal-dependent hydrolase
MGDTLRQDRHPSSSKVLIKAVAFLLAITAGLCPRAAVGQDAIFFSLEGEGTAYMMIDSPGHLGYITDGGRDGQAGILGARVEGRSALRYLLDQEVEQLVITCTHPHRDHFGGLETLICKDDNILKFRQLIFVDAPDSHGAAESLIDVFNRCRGSVQAPAARHISAAGRDAFASLRSSMKSVQVSNFVYSADSVGTHPHDRTIITRYEVGTGDSRRTVVDFDDASTRLIERWASAHPETPIDVLVVAHHGSEHNDSPLLFDDGRPIRQAILPVNRDNRYFHPGPQVVAQLVARLGADNVFVTDSTTGRNLRLTSAGLAYGDGTPPREALATFLQAQIVQLDQARHMAETALRGRAGSAPAAAELLATLDSGRLLDEKQVQQALTSNWLLTSHARSLRRAAAAIPVLTGTLARINPADVEHPVSMRWPATVAQAAGHTGVALGQGFPSPEFPERGTLMPLDSYTPRGLSWSPGRLTWSAALEQGVALGLAILPPASASPACVDLVDPSKRAACQLAEGWPTQPGAEEAIILFAPSDLPLALKLHQALQARGTSSFLIGPHLDAVGAVRDVSLTAELMANTEALAVLDTPNLRGWGGITIERYCSAQLTLRHTASRWTTRFVERQKAQQGDPR